MFERQALWVALRICGLRVAFLSGYYDAARYANAEADFVGGAFTRRAVQRLRHLAAEDKYKRRGLS